MTRDLLEYRNTKMHGYIKVGLNVLLLYSKYCIPIFRYNDIFEDLAKHKTIRKTVNKIVHRNR